MTPSNKNRVAPFLLLIALVVTITVPLDTVGAEGALDVDRTDMVFQARTGEGYVYSFLSTWQWLRYEGSPTTPLPQTVTVSNTSALPITANVNTSDSWCYIKGPFDALPLNSSTLIIPPLGSVFIEISLANGGGVDPPSDGYNTTSDPGYYHCIIGITDELDIGNNTNVSLRYKVHPAVGITPITLSDFTYPGAGNVCNYIDGYNDGLNPQLGSVSWFKPKRAQAYIVYKATEPDPTLMNPVVSIVDNLSAGEISYSLEGTTGTNLYYWLKTIADPNAISPYPDPLGLWTSVDINSLLYTLEYAGHLGLLSTDACNADLYIEPNPTSLTFDSIAGIAPPSKVVTLVYKSPFFEWTATTDESWCHVSPSSGVASPSLGFSITPSVSMDALGAPSTYNCNVTFTDINVVGPEGTYAVPVIYEVEPQSITDIKADDSDNDIIIPYNSSVTISWTYSNAASCTITPPGITSTYPAGNGSVSTGNLITGRTYTITCSPGTANDDVRVDVEGAENYTLTVTKSGQGSVTSSPVGISCGDDCAQTYDPLTSVNLTAVPAQGRLFIRWAEGCSGTDPQTSVIVDSSKICNAMFVVDPTSFQDF